MSTALPTDQRPARVGLIDQVRGFAILCMVLYHLGYDLVALFGVDWRWMFSPAMDLIRNLFAGAFICISGVACLYSHSNLRRGGIALALGFVMTAATWLMMRSQLILFGILHCLGCCMILYGLLHRFLEKIPTVPGAVVCICLLVITWRLPGGSVWLPFVGDIVLPSWLYQPWLAPLGLPGAGFFSSDYFPLLPWALVFFAGSFLGRPLRAGRAPDWVYRTQCKPLAFVGRHTIWVYLLHQPVVYGLLTVFFALFPALRG